MARSRKHPRPVRTLIVLAILMVVAAIVLTVGIVQKKTSPYPELALDLQGGTQLILTPKETEAELSQGRLNQAIEIIRRRIDASGVAEAEISSQGGQNIVVGLPGNPSDETLNLVKSSALLHFRPVIQAGPGVPLAPQAAAATEGEEAPAQPSPEELQEQAKKAADLDGDGKISDQPATEPKDSSDLAWRTEQMLLDFYTRDCSANSAEGDDYAVDKPMVACSIEGSEKYLLGPVEVEGKDLTQANASLEQTSQGGTTGKWVVNLQFNDAGAQSFANISSRLYDFQVNGDPEAAAFDPAAASPGSKPSRNRFGIVLDGKVISAPSMNATITDGKAQISGNFNQKSASSLANQLKFGALPLDFEVQSQDHISATLGSEHLQKGLLAGLIGLVLVALYLIWQYRGLSFIAIGSLLAAAVMVYLSIALLSWLMGYRLSLAGVAGLIIAVGVTADSFIVYFERIRDEVRDGRPLSAAVNEGWDRAKRTIVASDAINLLAAIVLYMLAVGGVQGFAFTLGLTTIVDLVVVFMFSHPMMLLVLKTKFFGQGHRLSGLDPEHLGATRATYAGRGRIRMPKSGDKKIPASTATEGGIR